MLFSSNIFLFVFLPLVLISYYCLQKIVKLPIIFLNLFLVFCSLSFFYWGSGKFIIVFFGSIIFNFIFGQLIGKLNALKKSLLATAIIINLSLLVYFKYFSFFYQQSSIIFDLNLPQINPIFLPIGISFYTFMAISYLVDIYQQKQKPANIINFALYISLFPHLVAGPIVRYQEIADKIKKRQPNIDQFFDGLWRFSIGLGKKVIIANSVGQLADKVFSLPQNEIGSVLAILGILAYTIQIYFDFSGYSDMAIGLASFFGFSFPENFNNPYQATSITDFWRRWHMSLSRFFRDYLYIPLGGSRLGSIRTYFNLLIVFILCGLWHGAAWTFVVWGLYHGLLLAIERIAKNKFGFVPSGKIFQLITFLLVSLGWIIFRSPNFSFAISYINNIFAFSTALPQFYTLRYFVPNNIAFFLVLGLVFSFVPLSKPKNTIVCGLIAIFILITSLAFLSKTSFTPFIYFQF
ncbi:MBOAT family protein [Candidatus Shapirobacteria bacterium]|nr:MBOAT family protein [Candidatus Shapirobacteria bacterium]